MAATYLSNDPDTALDWLNKGGSQKDWKCLYACRLVSEKQMSARNAMLVASRASKEEAMNFKFTVTDTIPPKSTPVAILFQVYPVIPAALQGVDLQVKIEMLFTVNKEGYPIDIKIINPSKYEALNAAATDALAQWRFKPATKNSKPVFTQVKLPMTFQSQR